MTRGTQRRGPSWPAALLVAAALGIGGTAVLGASPADDAGSAPERAFGRAAGAEPIALHPPFAGLAREAAPERPAPTRLSIPAAGVDARMVELGLLPDGAMEVPDDTRLTGWFTPGPVPGERGPAVVAGHVDSKHGPGVFWHLERLKPGDAISVDRDDGRRFVFTVTAVEQHPKTALPVDRIWAPTSGPALRLVTCGGTFDRTTRHYTDNVVVFAELVSSGAPQQALRART